MFLVTTNSIEGKPIVESLGLVRGNTIRARHIGHDIGLDIHEMPGVSINSEAVFQPNMVVCIEPFFYHDGGHPLWELTNKYGCEDMVLVTETGHEVLTPDSLIGRDIWIA